MAPHPDDETIGAFGLACHLRRRGAEVQVIIVTDGAASHSSQRWPPRRLAARRRAETRSAMRRAGIGAGAIRFLSFPDSGLEHLSPQAEKALRQTLSRGAQPDLVIRPDSSDYHADHKCVARACDKAWPRAVRQLTYLVWPDASSRDFAPRTRYRLPGSIRQRKVAAIRSYRTQTGLVRDDPDGFCMDRPLIARLSGPNEYFGEA
ncbi:MAG: PIG-L deacetylase family protein [Henriciella sp.]|uniref:PIG-L deacetylase family protein n=1 Tax=Henriciella sp. TaxID=1968823 RepID=UPI003C70814E